MAMHNLNFMKYVHDTSHGSPRMGITLYIVINPTSSKLS